MSTRPDLIEVPKLRLANVAYLNSVPLTWGWENAFTFEHPAVLAEKLARDELDGGLAPIFALLDAERFALVDGIGICARGPVYSVGVVAPRELDLGGISRFLLTDASRSSRNLLKVLLAEFFPASHPDFTDITLPEAEDPAWDGALQSATADLAACNQGLLLIGDRALAAHRALEGAGGELVFHDLAEIWGQLTGLPFVFAVWGLRTGLAETRLGAVADELRALAAHGLAHRREIAAEQKDPEFAYRYLTEHIQFRIGPEEKAGAAEYLRLLWKHGLVPASASLPRWI